MADTARQHSDVVDESHVDIAERLAAMREQESGDYAVPDYLSAEWQRRLRDAAGDAVPDVRPGGASPVAVDGAPAAGEPDDHDGSSSAASGSSQINELWREKICEWCYQVVDHFDFNREVVDVAVNYLDRYLATRAVNRRIFQLAAMTALYLAIKLFEPGHKLRMSSLIDLSRGYFMAEHVVTMEDSMLQSLGWRVHPPTPFAFCRDLVGLLPREVSRRARHDVTELARFMTELSVCDYWFATRRPSSVALAGLVCAIDVQGANGLDPAHKVAFLRRVVECGVDIAGDDEIVECYDRLREMYVAGGYTPNLEEDAREDARVAADSPTSISNPDGDAEPQDEAWPQVGCA